MVKPNLFLDITPPGREFVPDSVLTGTIVEALPGGKVAVQIDGADDDYPPVVVPSEAGITAVGATVRLSRDTSGRVTVAQAPYSLPGGAVPIHMGATGAAIGDALEKAQEAASSLRDAQAKANQAATDAANALKAALEAGDGTGVYVQAVDPADGEEEIPDGAIWFIASTDTAGAQHVTGMRVRQGGQWVEHTVIASQLLVPGSVGAAQIADGAVTAPKIQATNELWTKLLTVAGDATIGGRLLAEEIIGKTIMGSRFYLTGSSSGREYSIQWDGTEAPTRTFYIAAQNGSVTHSISDGPNTSWGFTRVTTRFTAYELSCETYDSGTDWRFPGTSSSITITVWLRCSYKFAAMIETSLTGTYSNQVTSWFNSATAGSRTEFYEPGEWVPLQIRLPAYTGDADYARLRLTCRFFAEGRLSAGGTGFPPGTFCDIGGILVQEESANFIALQQGIVGDPELTFYTDSGEKWVKMTSVGLTASENNIFLPWDEFSLSLAPPIGTWKAESFSRTTPPGSWVTVPLQWGVVTRDLKNGFTADLATYSLVVPYDGVYLATGVTQFAQNGTGRRGVGVTVNGTISDVFAFTMAPSVGSGISSATGPITLSAGDKVSLQAFQQSSGNLVLNKGILSLTRLSAS
ncbi:hypothetical protein [Actinobaculum sp. 352]|uniref:hypothetical protein n=1 Tax=Actinobaculum sp. 352 TaxID=2490946 RepID=UPI000F7EFCF1|nr:hypothetical protein [Actinobaculum sp. 352]RTE47726.1 hypothetical protein EKN07_12110 [Actinobaculum sp. 352]